MRDWRSSRGQQKPAVPGRQVEAPERRTRSRTKRASIPGSRRGPRLPRTGQAPLATRQPGPLDAAPPCPAPPAVRENRGPALWSGRGLGNLGRPCLRGRADYWPFRRPENLDRVEGTESLSGCGPPPPPPPPPPFFFFFFFFFFPDDLSFGAGRRQRRPPGGKGGRGPGWSPGPGAIFFSPPPPPPPPPKKFPDPSWLARGPARSGSGRCRWRSRRASPRRPGRCRERREDDKQRQQNQGPQYDGPHAEQRDLVLPLLLLEIGLRCGHSLLLRSGCALRLRRAGLMH